MITYFEDGTIDWDNTSERDVEDALDPGPVFHNDGSHAPNPTEVDIPLYRLPEGELVDRTPVIMGWAQHPPIGAIREYVTAQIAPSKMVEWRIPVLVPVK